MITLHRERCARPASLKRDPLHVSRVRIGVIHRHIVGANKVVCLSRSSWCPSCARRVCRARLNVLVVCSSRLSCAHIVLSVVRSSCACCVSVVCSVKVRRACRCLSCARRSPRELPLCSIRCSQARLREPQFAVLVPRELPGAHRPGLCSCPRELPQFACVVPVSCQGSSSSPGTIQGLVRPAACPRALWCSLCSLCSGPRERQAIQARCAPSRFAVPIQARCAPHEVARGRRTRARCTRARRKQ
jgi:hypothetical protein